MLGTRPEPARGEPEERAREDGLPPDPRASLDGALRLFWRWRRRFVLILGIGCVVGCVATVLLPRQYTARAVVLVGFRPAELTTADQTARAAQVQPEPDTDAAVELMTLPSVLSGVVAELRLADRDEFKSVLKAGPVARWRKRVIDWVRGQGERAPPDPTDVITDHLRRNLRVERIGHSALVSVAYSAADPKIAALIASAVASSPVEANFVKNLPIAERGSVAIVRTSTVSLAPVPHQPSFPNTKLMLLATVAISSSLALTAVLLGEYYAGLKFRGTEDVARRGYATLGLVPQLRRTPRFGAFGPKLAGRPQDAFAEAIAYLDLVVRSVAPQDGTTVFVTSALAEEGKSTIAAALAVSLRSAGTRVLLVDTNLRAPRPQRTVPSDPSTEPGRADDHAPDALAVQVDPVTGLSLVAAGAFLSRPAGLSRVARLRRGLAAWRTQYDLILIDGPPMLALGDARALAPLGDVALFVVRWGATRANTVQAAMRLLAESGTRIGGVVLSRVDLRQLRPEDSHYTPRHRGRRQGPNGPERA